MITITRPLILFFFLFLYSGSSFAIPESLGGFDADRNLNQSNYEQCAIQGPGSQAIDTATEFFNCHLKEDPLEFCQCVDRMAAAFNIPIDESLEKFQKYYTNYQTLNLNVNDLIEFRRELDFLNQVKTNNTQTCDLNDYLKPRDFEGNDIGRLLQEKFDAIGKFVTFDRENRGHGRRPAAEGEESDGDRRERGRGRGHRGSEDWHSEDMKANWEDLSMTRGILRSGSAVDPQTKTEMVNLMIRSMFSISDPDNPSQPLAKKYLSLSKDLHSPHDFQPNMNFMTQQKEENSGLAKNNARNELYRQIKENIKASHPDIYNNSLLGISESESTGTSEVDKTFQDALGNFVLNFEERAGNFDEIIPADQESAILDGQIIDWISPERASGRYGFNTAIQQTHQVQCFALGRRYKQFINNFKSAASEPTIQDAQDIYASMFSAPSPNEPLDLKKQNATFGYKRFEHSLRRIRRIQSFINPDKELSRDEQILPFLMDIHYCHKPPTSPEVPEQTMASLIGERGDASGARAPASHESVRMRDVHGVAENASIEDQTKHVVNQIKQSHHLKNAWDLKQQELDRYQMRESNLRDSMGHLRKEIEELNELPDPPEALIAEKEALLVDMQNDLTVIENRITVLQTENNDAYTAFNEFHVQAQDDPITGTAYFELYNVFVHNFKSCDIRPNSVGAAGRIITNPNYAAELAACNNAAAATVANSSNIVSQRAYAKLTASGTDLVLSTTEDEVVSDLQKEQQMRDNQDYLSSAGSVNALELYTSKPNYESDMKSIIKRELSNIGKDKVGSDDLYKGLLSTEGEDPFDDAIVESIEDAINNNEIKSVSKNIQPQGQEATANKLSDQARELASEQQKRNSGLADQEFNEFRQNLSEARQGFESQPAAAAGQQAGSFDFGKLGNIEAQADALAAREKELEEGQKRYQESIAETEAASDEIDPNSPYGKLLEELKALRAENEGLRDQVSSVLDSREKMESETDELREELDEDVDQEASTQTRRIAQGQSGSSNNFGSSGFNDAPGFGGNSAPAGNAQVASVTPSQRDVSLPTPTDVTSGGDGSVSLPAAGGRSIASVQGASKGEIISNDGLTLSMGADASTDPLVGTGGFELFLSLVGSNNEVSIETFRELRTDPNKFEQMNLDPSKPLIVKTPHGHLVMMPVVQSEKVSGFRYIKDIKPSQVDRRIASERDQIVAGQQRLVREADLESLLATERETSSN